MKFDFTITNRFQEFYSKIFIKRIDETLEEEDINFAIKVENTFHVFDNDWERKVPSGTTDKDGGRRIAHRPRGIIKLNRRQLNYRRPRLTAQLIIR